MKNLTKRCAALVMVFVMAFAFVPAANVFAQEGPLAQIEIQGPDGSAVNSVDIVTGASMVYNLLPLDAEGNIYGEYDERTDALDRGDYLWFGEEVTFVLGMYIDGELYIGDRFANGPWGGIRAGWGRRNFLFVHLSPENNRTDVSLIEPGSYEFYVFAISGNAPMPNPLTDGAVHYSEFPYLEGAVRTAFTVNVLEDEVLPEVDEELPEIDDTGLPEIEVITVNATPTAHSIFVNGEEVAFRAFNIQGSNFFLLRDIAYVLSGTPSQFEVTIGDTGYVEITTGVEYTPIGGEMAPPETTSATATLNIAVPVYIDGESVNLLSYNLGNINFFMLRDLSEALGFEVNWDPVTSSVLILTQ